MVRPVSASSSSFIIASRPGPSSLRGGRSVYPCGKPTVRPAMVAGRGAGMSGAPPVVEQA